MIAEWMPLLKILSQQKPLFDSVRLKGLGVIISAVILAMAIFALRHTLKNVDYEEVFAVVERTRPELIALALLLVIISYASLTIYDLFALRTIGHPEVPCRIAALASFTSYPIAHGIGAVAFVSPVIRYRIYVCNGLGAMDVANICFLTGLTFWLGNLTAFGLSVLYEPAAISLIDYLPLALNRWLAAALLVGVAAFVIWSWRSPRSLGAWRWPVRLPSGPMVLLQIVIGVLDLGSAALAMYVLIPASADVGVFQIAVVFIVATLLGFASHTPADRRVRRDDPDRAWRRGQGAADCRAVDVSLPLPLPAIRDGARPVRCCGRLAKPAQEAGIRSAFARSGFRFV